MNHDIFRHILGVCYKHADDLFDECVNDRANALLFAFYATDAPTHIRPRESISRDRLTMAIDGKLEKHFPSDTHEKILYRLMEGWQYCVNNLFVAPMPKLHGEGMMSETPYFITEEGMKRTAQLHVSSDLFCPAD